MNNSVAIIGGGASGSFCAYFLLKAGFSVTIFDKSALLKTILPTGGGKCNLAHAEFDPKELAANYPRGEKFLYSVFSKFGTAETLEIFESIGVKTYIRDDGRIFPESNSAKEVQLAILKELRKYSLKYIQKEIINLETLKNYKNIVIATGGHSGYKLLEQCGVKIIEPKPSLVGLKTMENFECIKGTAVKNALCEGFSGDILFTHFGVSGPLIYTISSINARKDFPYIINIDLCPELIGEILQNEFNKNPHKNLKNVLGTYLPHKLANFILNKNERELKSHNVDGKTRNLIIDRVHKFTLNVTGTDKGEETVTSGGVDLDEINPKTMALKKNPNIFCIGEVLNIDGLCGGYNLQNAWSTAYVCAQSIISSC